ncbi:MAG: hypothetical protein ABIB43_00315 [archaeon]
MKLLLVYPANEYSTTNTATYSLPLGLGSIATYAKQKLNDLEIKILDGSIMSHQEQEKELEKFKPDVAGFSPTMASQGNAKKLAKQSKELNSMVFFGGVNSTNLWFNNLKNNDFIDGVFLYEAEIGFFQALNRLKEYQIMGPEAFGGIQNLAHRDSHNNIIPPKNINIPSLSDIPNINYSIFDLDTHFKETIKKGFGKGVTYYGGKGCSKRGNMKLKSIYTYEEYNELIKNMNTCTFCGRNELGFRTITEKREEEVIKELNENYGVDWFFNVQDTVNLENKHPVGISPAYRFFIGLENVTEKSIEILKQRYGEKLIFQVGIEAATPEMRKVYGKKETNNEDIYKKTELMKKNNIELHASFILGGRGETEESMEETVRIVKRLSEYNNVTWILISPQLILPGSPDHKAFLQMPLMNKKYCWQDHINLEEISSDFMQYFTPSLTRKRVVETIANTFSSIKRKENLVLDVKGVTAEEENYIGPRRSYTK